MSTTERAIFSGMKVLIDGKWHEDQAVIVEGREITALIAVDMIKHHLPAKQYEYSTDHYLVPGFIDMHMHGAGGYDVMDGSVEALKKISQILASEGITGYLATTMTASSDDIEAALAVIPEAMEFSEGAAILGVHLEGPFISPEKMGAQNIKHACAPDITLFKKWQKLSGDHIKLVTIAPELENALAFIQELRPADVAVAIGHTNATYAQTMEAIAGGCTHATHLFNAMRPLLQREPGAVGALLLANEISGELIADGIHLHPAICELALRVKGRERLILVTDAMRAKCMGDGSYDLGGQTVHVKGNKATLPDGTLAGSVLRMPEAIKNFIGFSGCSLEDAIYLASYNPASKLKMSNKKGSIDVGKDADLVVMSKDLKIELTMREGNVVFEKSE